MEILGIDLYNVGEKFVSGAIELASEYPKASIAIGIVLSLGAYFACKYGSCKKIEKKVVIKQKEEKKPEPKKVEVKKEEKKSEPKAKKVAVKIGRKTITRAACYDPDVRNRPGYRRDIPFGGVAMFSQKVDYNRTSK